MTQRLLTAPILSLLPAHAAVIVVAPSSTTTGSIQFTEDITFTTISPPRTAI
ncbi:MAG: hypothetical protein J0I10_03135 [Verrucomicrobia bacterium]|nr:hypothetical protein [Verrucomicrobiota bacterium]